MTVTLDGLSLTIDDVACVSRHGEAVPPAPRALERMRRAHVEPADRAQQPRHWIVISVGTRKSGARTKGDP